MKCPKCQFESREGAKFCKECGNRLELACPQCGSAYTPGTKFCDECGQSLTEVKETLPVDYDQPQSYTPKFLADKILTTRSSIEGERKLVTVLFADVANYTSMAEKLDPEEVHEIMDGCFQVLMDEIHRYEGTINQFTGDGVMALFGAPLAHEDHAQRACHAALAIQIAVGKYGEKIEKEHGVGFKLRIGLNSGPVIVGSIGDDLRMDYTAVGDTTNLGSRMESMAMPGAILVSGNTHRLARDFFEFESLEKVKVKGKDELQEAFELIKTGEVETRIGASVAKGLTRFVGRKNSTTALLDAFKKVKSGAGQVLGLVGEAGVGKSRLLLEMRNPLPHGEHTYLEGRCLQYGGSMAYLPMLDILRSYFDIKEGDREFLVKKKIDKKILDLDERLKGIIPPFQDLLSLKVDDDDFAKLEPQEKRERTFEAIRDLIIRMSQERPLVLAIEDLHWIDKTSEEFLSYLIGWLANTSILLILLYRPEYSHPWGSKSYYTKVGLDQLGTASSSELVKAILEKGDVAPEIKQLILNRAAGNPLFMEEFTNALLENGSIERKDKRYVLSGKVSEIQVPDTIQGIIAARMDRLEDNLKRTMQVASVIGRDFAFRILQTITGMREELKPYLLNLQGLEFIYEKRLFPELEYIFKHALTQEVAYNSLLLKRRKVIHENIGKAIEELYPERLEEFYEMLAFHYSKSHNIEKAYQYLKLSGNKATKNHSLWEAFRFYREAANVLSDLPESDKNRRSKLEVLHLLTVPMAMLGYPEDSSHILQEGATLSTDLGDRRSHAIFLSKIGHSHFTTGNPLLGIEFCEKCLHEAEQLQDVSIMASIGNELCGSYLVAGNYLRVVDIAQKVITLVERSEKQHEFFGRPFNVYVDVLGYYGLSMGMLGSFEKAKIFCEKGLKFALEINHLASLSYIELCYGWVHLQLGNGKDAAEHFHNSIAYAEEGQIILVSGMAWAALGIACSLMGDLETARNYIRKGIKIQEDAEIPLNLSLSYCALGWVHFETGDLEQAQKFVEKAVNLARQRNEKSVEGVSRIWMGRILGKKDKSRVDKAEGFILQGIKILEELKQKPSYAEGYVYLGELYGDTGHREKALENLKKAEGMFKEMGMDYMLARTQEVLEGL